MANELGNESSNEYSRLLKQLIKLAKEKLIKLEDILTLTQSQTNELDSEELDKLLSLIDAKQKHIDAINILDDEFDSIYAKVQPLFSSDMNSINPALKLGLKELKESVAAVTAKMHEIRDLEQKNNAAITQNFDGLKEQLKSVNRGIKSYTAYKKPEAQNGGVFIDKRK